MTYCQDFTQYLELVFTLEIIIWKTEPGSLHEIGRWNVMVTILTLVLLTFSLFYPFTLVVTTGTSSDLSRKVRVTVYKGYKKGYFQETPVQDQFL